jgi:hypothetical protein
MRYRSARIVPGTNLPSSIDSSEIEPDCFRDGGRAVESLVLLPGTSTNRRVWSSLSYEDSFLDTITGVPHAGHEVALFGISFEQAEQRVIGGGLYHVVP